MEYPWYKEIKKGSVELNQGDLIPNCPIFIPPPNLSLDIEANVEYKEIDAVVLSQSCDLSHDKIEIVLVCPHYPLSKFLANLPPDQTTSKKAKDKIIDNLRKGYLPSYHLLNKDSRFDPLKDYQVVDFKNVYGIHFESLNNIVSNLNSRIRLLPPYREHLSQSFARYFMRVGLPQDITIEGY
jgi:hypothetical protein